MTPTLEVLSLGVVDYERHAFHSNVNIFPIGFKSIRTAPSMTVIGETDKYYVKY